MRSLIRSGRIFMRRGKQQIATNHHRHFRSSITSNADDAVVFRSGAGVYYAAAAMIAALAFHNDNTDDQNQQPQHLTLTEAAAAKMSRSNTTPEFKLKAALEFKEEMQKVKLARFLNELTELAKAKQNKSNKGVIKKFKTEWLGGHDDEHEHGTIDLRGINIGTLKTGEAMYILEQIQNGGKMSVKAVVQVCQAVTALLRKEPTLIDKKNIQTVTVVGDLHGSLGSLKKVIELAGDFRGDPTRCIVFDGDFVDRGDESLEVFMMLLLLKLAVPDQVVLIRGNHEDTMVAKVYGFADELKTKYFLSEPAMNKLWGAMGDTFAALPLGVVTDTAFIVHGGLPSKEFRLKDLQKVTSKERSQFFTLVEPKTKMEKMVESLLWSDPSRKKGVNVSPRGTGVLFGRDVANTFLTAEKLKYIVRGHEPVEEGVKEMDCGDGMRVITVFSAANYPNEEGHNVGALLHLLSDGGHDSITFNYKEQKEGILDSLFSWVGMTEKSLQSIVSAAPPDDKLRIYINEKKFRLLKAFSAVEKDGLVSKEDWASVMRKSMDLGRVGWAELQPRIAPTTVPGGDYINWREYLIENTTDIRTRLDDEEKMGKTVDWMDKMLVIFEFLDLGRNGSVGLQEFIAGTRLLNRYHLPKIRQITDPVELFSRFDDDHSGRITLDEIQDHLSHSHIVVKMKKFVGKQQLKTVAKNTDMLKLAFEFMDKAGSGTITFEEWQAGINLLNKKLHRNEKVYDAKELFMMMDIDGSGEIDIEEFKDLFGSL